MSEWNGLDAEISVTGLKIVPCEHSIPVTGKKFFLTNSFAFATERPKWHNLRLVCSSTSIVCDLSLLVKS